MILDKSKGEFNFNMLESERENLQYQARYAGENSEAIRGLEYNIVTVKKTTRRQRKTLCNQSNKKSRKSKGQEALSVFRQSDTVSSPLANSDPG